MHCLLIILALLAIGILWSLVDHTKARLELELKQQNDELNKFMNDALDKFMNSEAGEKFLAEMKAEQDSAKTKE